jgi:hypothetical protein
MNFNCHGLLPVALLPSSTLQMNCVEPSDLVMVRPKTLVAPIDKLGDVWGLAWTSSLLEGTKKYELAWVREAQARIANGDINYAIEMIPKY